MRFAHDWGQTPSVRHTSATVHRGALRPITLAVISAALVAGCTHSATAPAAASDANPSNAVIDAASATVSTRSTVRYPLVAILPSVTKMTVGQQVSFTSRLSDGGSDVWMGRFMTWTSSNSAVVSVATTQVGASSGDIGLAKAIKAGSATLTATTQSATIGQVTITVSGSGSGGSTPPASPPPTSPPPSGPSAPSAPPPSGSLGSGGGHEPSGMSAQINTGSISSTPSGLTVFSPSSANAQGETSRNLSVVPGGTGLRVTYPTNVSGGYSPVRFGMSIGSPGTGWYYQRMKVRFSSNWNMSGNVDVKLCEPRTQQSGNVSGPFENHVVAVHDFETQSTHAWLYTALQGPNGHFRDLFEQPTYSAAADLNTGGWHTVEMLYQPESSPGAGNGGYTAWVDGNQIAHYTDVLWLASGNRAGWPYLMFDPTYGGGLHNPSSTMYWDFDQLYVSTK